MTESQTAMTRCLIAWLIYIYFYSIIFSVTAQLPGANGYSGGKVVFIDTENTLYLLTLSTCINLFFIFNKMHHHLNLTTLYIYNGPYIYSYCVKVKKK